MILTYNARTQEFQFLGSFQDRLYAKSAGMRWHPERKAWLTKSAQVAVRLVKYADESALVALGEKAQASTSDVADSHARDADIDVPLRPGLDLMPFQRAGVAYASSRRDVLIADEMGLGKTVQAICLGNLDRDLDKVLVVCPASLRLNWKAEWRRWSIHDSHIGIIQDTWPAWIEGDRPPGLFTEFHARVVIVSFEGAVKWRLHLDRQKWGLLIVDECHNLSNPDTKRTKAVWGHYPQKRDDWVPPLRAKRRVALTGTPIHRSPADLWPLLRALDPDGLGNKKTDFCRRYVDPPPEPHDVPLFHAREWVRRETETRLAELQQRLRAGIMVRRLKADVLTDLPAKRRQIVLVDFAGAQTLVRNEQRVLDRKKAELEQLGHGAAVQRLAQWRGAAMQEISRVRKETALRKLPASLDQITEVMAEVDKVVVFAHHHEVIDGLVAGLRGFGVVHLDGRDSPTARDAAVTAFQNDPKVRVFVGGIRAAGLGLTLTAASTVIMVELDWNPSALVQAEDRCHRIGQRDSVLVQHLVIDGSIDARMSRVLIEKMATAKSARDGPGAEEDEATVLGALLA